MSARTSLTPGLEGDLTAPEPAGRRHATSHQLPQSISQLSTTSPTHHSLWSHDAVLLPGPEHSCVTRAPQVREDEAWKLALPLLGGLVLATTLIGQARSVCDCVCVGGG